MRPLGIILGLILAFHVTASADCQTSDTDTATGQPTVKPTVQISFSQTAQQTVQERTSEDTTSVATQSCHATDHYWWVSYSVLIRVPYGGAKDCDDTYHALESATASISNWQCVEKGGNIQLWFNAFPNYGSAINGALESRYPSVNSFNCADH